MSSLKFKLGIIKNFQCERFAAGNLTAEELALGQIGANYLYRHEPVIPLFGHAVAMSPSSTWTSAIGYQLQPMPNARFLTTILWLTSPKHLTQLAIYEGHDVGAQFSGPFLISTCELRHVVVSQDDNILERLRGGFNSIVEDVDFGTEPRNSTDEEVRSIILEGDKIFLGTTHSIYRFPTDICGFYSTEELCLASGDPHCAWNNQIFRCISILTYRGPRHVGLSLSVDVTKRPQCPATNRITSPSQDNGWSKWRPCSMTVNHHPDAASSAEHSCLCRICLSDNLCNFGEQQVSQCKGK